MSLSNEHTLSVGDAVAALSAAISELPDTEFQEAWVALGMITQALAKNARFSAAPNHVAETDQP